MYFFQICRSLSSSNVQAKIIHDHKTYPVSGARTVFNGIDSETMFAAQTALLPELGPGEILVKVI
jgi:hypothetical protein